MNNSRRSFFGKLLGSILVAPIAVKAVVEEAPPLKKEIPPDLNKLAANKDIYRVSVGCSGIYCITGLASLPSHGYHRAFTLDGRETLV